MSKGQVLEKTICWPFEYPMLMKILTHNTLLIKEKVIIIICSVRYSNYDFTSNIHME